MPASMITAWVALRPNVTGSRIEMPDNGPMPGSTPTSVPTRQPRNAYQTLSSCSATENPCSKLCRVASTLESEWAGAEGGLEHVDERQIGEADDADAVEPGVEDVSPLDRHEQDEHHQHHGGEEAERLEQIDRHSCDRRHGDRMCRIRPLDLGE